MSDITGHTAHKVINGLMGFHEIFLQQETLILYSRQYWHLYVKQGILLQPGNKLRIIYISKSAIYRLFACCSLCLSLYLWQAIKVLIQ